MHSGIHWRGGVCIKLMNPVRAMMIFVDKQRCAVIMKLLKCCLCVRQLSCHFGVKTDQQLF